MGKSELIWWRPQGGSRILRRGRQPNRQGVVPGYNCAKISEKPHKIKNNLGPYRNHLHRSAKGSEQDVPRYTLTRFWKRWFGCTVFLPEANSSLQTSMNITVELKLFKSTYILQSILVEVMWIYLKTNQLGIRICRLSKISQFGLNQSRTTMTPQKSAENYCVDREVWGWVKSHDL